MKEQIAHMTSGGASEHIGTLAAGVLPDPINFVALEQSRAYKELEATTSSEACLSHGCPKSVPLSLSLAPLSGSDEATGQRLCASLAFLDASQQDNIVEAPLYEAPEITHFHFARADPDNGNDVELPPSGKASPRAIGFALDRIPKVAQCLQGQLGLRAQRIRCGQALANLTGPNGPDDSNEIGIGPTGFPTASPSIESREGPAREFRETGLGPDSERLWGAWG